MLSPKRVNVLKRRLKINQKGVNPFTIILYLNINIICIKRICLDKESTWLYLISHKGCENFIGGYRIFNSISIYYLNISLKNCCIFTHDFLSASGLYANGILNFFPNESAFGLVKLCLVPL